MQNIIEIDGKKYKQTIEPVVEEKPKHARFDKKIVLEIGHDKDSGDPGAVDSRTGKDEYTLNVIAANAAYEQLKLMGYTNVTIADPLKRLFDIGFELTRDTNVFVSIHHNAYSNENAQGSECLYSPKGDDDDITLASMIAAKCSKVLGIRNRGAKKMNLGILSGATYDRYSKLHGAVLAEGYFITGVMRETHDVMSVKYGKALASAIDEFLDFD